MGSRPRLVRPRPRGSWSLRRSWLSARIAIAIGAAIIIAGCGGAATDPDVVARPEAAPVAAEPPATEAPATTTATAPPSPNEVEVRAVMDRFWPAYLEAISIPDPANAVLVELLTGDAEHAVLGRFEGMARVRQRAVPPEPSVYSHRIVSIAFSETDVATVRECVVDDLRVIQDVQGTAEPTTALIDGDVVTAEVTTSLVEGEAGWQITVRDSTEVLQGVRDCAIFSA